MRFYQSPQPQLSAIVFGIIVVSGLATDVVRADDVEIISPADNSTVTLPNSNPSEVEIKARFHNGFSPASAYILSGDGMTEYANYSKWAYITDPNDPEGGYHRIKVPIAYNNYSNVQVKVTGSKTLLGPPHVTILASARTTGITISK